MAKLRLHYIEDNYVEYLRAFDKRIPETKGERRPFVGIIVMQGMVNYFVPLTSPKLKHGNMKNAEDFLLLKNNRNEIIGALNFNNMIPLTDLNLVRRVDFSSLPETTRCEIAYNTLIQKQYNAISKVDMGVVINAKAQMIREKQINGTLSAVICQRCVDYKTLEDILTLDSRG